ncbi:MAG: hypothetical protein Q8S00_00010 [Deltaproteobacteria bacterium]|nr:hypothetical protein [Deltaproteobacteria bacterium]MDZ4343849.1 hypothetical protein [Candidatus Binatia bacterium]
MTKTFVENQKGGVSMQTKVTVKKKSAAKKTTPKKNSPNKAKRTSMKEVATKTSDVDSASR